MKTRLERLIDLGLIDETRPLIAEKLQRENKITEPKDCPECNALDGQDIDCETCGGAGSIDVVKPLTQEELDVKVETYLKSRYSELRANEYPPLEEFADAWVKDDVEGMEVYKRKCIAVKVKYPKGDI